MIFGFLFLGQHIKESSAIGAALVILAGLIALSGQIGNAGSKKTA